MACTYVWWFVGVCKCCVGVGSGADGETEQETQQGHDTTSGGEGWRWTTAEWCSCTHDSQQRVFARWEGMHTQLRAAAGKLPRPRPRVRIAAVCACLDFRFLRCCCEPVWWLTRYEHTLRCPPRPPPLPAGGLPPSSAIAAVTAAQCSFYHCCCQRRRHGVATQQLQQLPGCELRVVCSGYYGAYPQQAIRGCSLQQRRAQIDPLLRCVELCVCVCGVADVAGNGG